MGNLVCCIRWTTQSSESLYILPTFFVDFLQFYFYFCHFDCMNRVFFMKSPSSNDIVNAAAKHTFSPMFFDLSVKFSVVFLCSKKYCFISLSISVGDSPSQQKWVLFNNHGCCYTRQFPALSYILIPVFIRLLLLV